MGERKALELKSVFESSAVAFYKPINPMFSAATDKTMIVRVIQKKGEHRGTWYFSLENSAFNKGEVCKKILTLQCLVTTDSEHHCFHLLNLPPTHTHGPTSPVLLAGLSNHSAAL